MKKYLPIVAPGWISIPVLRVCPFGHHARNIRHTQAVQDMSQAEDRDGFQAGIAEDDFVRGADGRIAGEGGFDIER